MGTELTIQDMVIDKLYRIVDDPKFQTTCANALVKVIRICEQSSSPCVKIEFMEDKGAWVMGDTMHIVPYNLVSCS